MAFRIGLARRRSPDRDIVGLRSAAGEKYFIRHRADQVCDFDTRRFDRIPRAPPECVGRGGIAELIAKVGQHRVEHGVVDRRGGIVVKINRFRAD